jgi:hypothetical protein
MFLKRCKLAASEVRLGPVELFLMLDIMVILPQNEVKNTEVLFGNLFRELKKWLIKCNSTHNRFP